jgi:hypothetical protein
MPRPKDGYKNAAGHPIPGVHDPITRFMDTTALKFWAYKQGKAGKPLFDRTAIDIGSCVHTMAELDLQGQSAKAIKFFLDNTLRDPNDIAKAQASFDAFCRWREQFHVRPYLQEKALISERFQFAGTPDTIAIINNQLGILDFKTSPTVYPDNLVALAAYGQLWTENNPELPLAAGYHMIILPKDGSGFQHYAYADLSEHWRLFQLYLQAYHLDKECSAKEVLAGSPIPKSNGKPRVRIAAPSVRASMTMGEVLRAYGHVNGGARA